jgi:arylsulfatase
VFLLVLDTFRGDHLGRIDRGTSITPRLDALAAESVVFPNAFAPSNWTRGSMPGLLASLPYAVVGNTPGPGVATFATELQRAGFHTAGASANPLVSARLGWAHGYDEFVDPNAMGDLLVAHPLQMIGAAATAPAYRVRAATNAVYFRAATEMRRRALDLLDRMPQPAFLHLQTMDTHGPYLPPHAWLPDDFDFGDVSSYYTFMQLRGTGVIGTEAFRPRLDNFRARYAASARYVDAEIGALLDGLRERGRYDEALIWVVSDHGEAFGEHDVAGHTGLDLPNELLRVPLLVKLPRSWGVAPRREAAPVSAYSLLPTTLSLLGLPSVPHAFGTDLAGLVRGDPTAAPDVLFCDSIRGHTSIHAVIRWPWKLVALQYRDGTTEVRGLYDLARGFEDVDSRAAEEPQRVAALLDDLHGFRTRVAALKPSREDRAIDAATEEQLRKLGYIQ